MKNKDNKVVRLKPHKGIQTPLQARALLDRCRGHTLEHLRTLLQRMLDNADDTLFAMADQASNHADKNRYFDAMRTLRQHRQEIESRFYRNIEAGFERFWRSGSGQGADPESAVPYFADLSVSGEPEREEALALRDLCTRLRHNFGPEIDAIEQRLEAITDDREVDERNNPMGPALICDAFRDATRALDTEPGITLIIHKLFDTQMMADMGHLYDAINHEFLHAGVLPRLRVRIRQGATDRHADAAIPAAEETAARFDNRFLERLQALLAQPHDPAADKAATDTGLIRPEQLIAALTALQHGATPARTETSRSAAIRAAMQDRLGDATGQTPALDRLDSDIIDIVAMMFDFILDDPNLPDQARALIGRLQIPMLKVAILDKSFFANRAHPARKLLNELAAAGQTLDNQANIDLRLLEKMATIVHRVLDEFDDDIRLFEDLLTELGHFLQLRRTEEQAGQAEARRQFAAHEQREVANQRVRQTLRDVLGTTRLPVKVLRIIMGPWHDVMAWTWMKLGDRSTLWKNELRFLDVLIWSVQPRPVRVDRNRLDRVVRKLMENLHRGLADIDYPTAKVSQIFRAVEPLYLASLHGLPAKGEAGEDTAGQAHSLLDSLQDFAPDASLFVREDGIHPDLRQHHADEEDATMLNLDQRRLREHIARQEQQFATLDDLDSVLGATAVTDAGGGDEADFEQLVLQDISRAGWEARSRPTKSDPANDVWLEQVRQIKVGAWLEFTDEHNRRTRARLAWKSEVLNEYLFTNWKYQVLADKTLHELATALRLGNARIIDEEPLLDRALSAILHGPLP